MRSKTISKMRVISVIMSLLMIISVISFPSLNAKADGYAGTLDDFVERCYTVTLDRPSDIDGFNYWKNRVLNGEAVGIEVAYGFLFSPEYTKKNKSNSAYVRDLYTLFMGRDPDDAGYNDWMNRLDEGQSRLDVFVGFANSQEFYNICESYGITAGRYVAGYDRNTINNVNLFVERMYKICLGRIGDKDGQNDWAEKLMKKEISGSECARSFIFSKEYINKGLSDEDFVENLYLAMFGRPSDDEGKYNWLFALKNGMTRDEVFAGFANSIEFDNICKAYGINRGSYTAKDKGTYNPNGNGNNGEEGDDNTASGNNTLGEHTHVFALKNTDSKYLYSFATCQSPALFYYSCKCGEKGENTFEYGTVVEHSYYANPVSQALKSKATCTQAPVYYYSCTWCGKLDKSRTFTFGDPDPDAHKYDAVANFQHLTTAVEDGYAMWACLNGCGNVKKETYPCELNKAKVGDIIALGVYEQDGNTGYTESIDWIILSKENGRALLLSEEALDVLPYNTTDTEVTWKDSSLRKWLNEDFYSNAFTNNEKNHIPKVTIPNNDSVFGTSGGGNTKDYVFCLSLEELVTYFGDYMYYNDVNRTGYNEKLICNNTRYAYNRYPSSRFTAFNQTQYDNYYKGYGYSTEFIDIQTCNWWLRSIGYTSKKACYVGSQGGVGAAGEDITMNEFMSVRPAMYVDYDVH